VRAAGAGMPVTSGNAVAQSHSGFSDQVEFSPSMPLRPRGIRASRLFVEAVKLKGSKRYAVGLENHSPDGAC
jgi:hypothetical protein